jgi:hypothetical protein
MADRHKSGDTSPQVQLVLIRGILQRIEQAEQPEKFGIIKQLLLERLSELESLAEQEAPDANTRPV